jgi:hypothetical protein
MEQHFNGGKVTLDDLLALVDKATQAIERLHSENAYLLRQVHEYKAASAAAAAELATQKNRIQAMERAEFALMKDAQWCKWFRNKYGDSTFFSHIEKEFQLSLRSTPASTDAARTIPFATADAMRKAVHRA